MEKGGEILAILLGIRGSCRVYEEGDLGALVLPGYVDQAAVAYVTAAVEIAEQELLGIWVRVGGPEVGGVGVFLPFRGHGRGRSWSRGAAGTSRWGNRQGSRGRSSQWLRLRLGGSHG